MIKISDTGSGIKKNNIKKIFEPFYSTKKAGQSGTGLGMAIVYGTVQDHNGYIDVQSNIKKGTDFIIYFNSVIQDDKSSPEYDSVSDYKNSFDHKSIPEYENITDYKTINENLMGFNENILIIEDQKNQLDMTKTILESLNYTIKCAHNTQSAVSLVKKDLFDLIIFDMLLDNNETGLDCYKEILKINPQQKALIISGFSKTEKVKTAQKLGAGKFIRKPFTINIIAQAVKEELSK
jgi:ActR/RegA family two-component response regulator